ncbi:MAG TPA: zinc-binding dehydrogenase, partial [Acidimicrobiales bacterium]|nr:zinc-binding dehydrogenase [Acidimicrobiales bacterium]
LGAIAMESLRRPHCCFGETVLVCGAGLLGLLITQLAAVAGIYVVAMDLDAQRLTLASQNGASFVVGAASPATVDEVRRRTGGWGVDAAIVAAAAETSDLVNAALDCLRVAGRLVALGAFGMDLDRERFFRAQATFVPSMAYGPGRYDPVYEENNLDYPIGAVRWTENRNMAHFLRLLEEGRIDLARIPTSRVLLQDAPTAYPTIGQAGCPLTAVLSYGEEQVSGLGGPGGAAT